jgi:23S rRNA (adenine2503-C2)-methyltransferase
MRVLVSGGRDDIATVYIAEMGEGKLVEFVESVQPPIPREKKWVLLVSTMFGCPVKCLMCDAGSDYRGKLSKEEIFDQIDFLIKKRFQDRKIPVDKLKIQFARMGEPAFDVNVVEVIDELQERYDAPGLMPAISTIAPVGTDKFFERLLAVKKERYAKGHFQMQFSIHTTDRKTRDRLIPVEKWDFSQIAEYGKDFHEKDDRKITLNFALGKGIPVEPEVLLRHFDCGRFLIKITPVNPTYQAAENEVVSYIDPYQEEKNYEVVNRLRSSGYEVILSIGETEENCIGSNCGQYVTRL